MSDADLTTLIEQARTANSELERIMQSRTREHPQQVATYMSNWSAAHNAMLSAIYGRHWGDNVADVDWDEIESDAPPDGE